MPIDEPTDAELMAASRRDPEAFGHFYDRHVAAVLSFLYRRTDSAETAADLCAETFAAAFAQRKRYQDAGPALAWLLGIARNQLGHFLRRQQVSTRYRRRLGLPDATYTDSQLDRIEELVDAVPFRNELRAALEQLSDPIAEAVRLRIAADLPYPAVAEQLGCTEGTARVRVSRGLSQLADLLDPPDLLSDPERT